MQCKHCEKRNTLQQQKQVFYKYLNTHWGTSTPTVVRLIQMGIVAHADWSSRCRRSLASLGAESAMESLRMRREEQEEEERSSEERGEKRKEEGHGTSLSLIAGWKRRRGEKAGRPRKKHMHLEMREKLVAINENHRGLCKRIRFCSDDWAVKCVSQQLPVSAHHTRPCKVRRKTADQTTREGDGEG